MRKLALGSVILLFVITSLIVTYGNIHAEKKWSNISARELKKKIDDGDDFLLINVLPKIVFNAGYIKGSVNVPIGKLEASPIWPKEKNKKLIFYCMGVA